ncbi:MAG: MFS transporter [Planctomycetaceae bacterium]
MPLADSNATRSSETAATTEDGNGRVHEQNEARNLVFLAMQQIVIRIGWIFKTESVIMPAFVDMIAGPAWIRGCLPVLNRLGQSIPQFLFADRLRSMPLKRRPLGLFVILMGAPFLVLSALLAVPGAVGSTWLPAVFLCLYLFFFSMTGLNQLCLGTITGKLISPARRGRIIALSGVVGVTLSITTAWNLLPRWLEMRDGGFVWIFLFVGTMFVLASITSLFVREEPDNFTPKKRVAPFRDGWKRVRSDSHLARLLVVSALFVSALLLVPHYQALARGGRRDFGDLMFWVVSQNASAGVMALASGIIADKFGYRLTMRILLLLAGCCPIVAIALATWADPKWFVLIFILFGAIPVTFRSLENYCLELTTSDHHALYISTLKMFMPITLLLSPLVGLLVDQIGFAPVFITIGLVNICGMVMTFFIDEPRHWPNKRSA